jgi:outer membrane protein TolC
MTALKITLSRRNRGASLGDGRSPPGTACLDRGEGFLDFCNFSLHESGTLGMVQASEFDAPRLMRTLKNQGAIAIIAGSVAAVGVSSKASALQPLDAFVQAARRANPNNKAAGALAAQREAEAQSATGRLYPSVTATGTYTRNQYEVAITLPGTTQSITIQPQNQLDGALTLTVPVIDLGGLERIRAAKATAEAASLNGKATTFDVERRVAEIYFQLLGQEAVLEAARRQLDVARNNASLVRNKKANGAASELDVQRADANVARAEGDVASANLAVVTARRQLASTTSVEPEPATEFPTDDLHEETPLASWLPEAANAPSVAAADATVRAAERGVSAAKAAWLPTVSGAATERVTNAPSFVGHKEYYLLQGILSWRFDATLAPAVRAASAAAAGAQARADGAHRDAEDAIFQAWHQVETNIEKGRAARAQVSASRLASDLARDRYSVGAATQLDVIQAEQDSFRAEVERIQVDTSLAYARTALRLYAGHLVGAKGQ